MSLANVSIVGNLVRAPEQLYFASGKTKTTFTVAVNVPSRLEKGPDGADFYRVEAWGRLAELAAAYLVKGNQVTASGRLIMDKWTDKEGRQRITPTVKADQIAFPRRLKTGEENALTLATPIGGELEFADYGHESNQTMAEIDMAANMLMSPSAQTTSSSADTAKAATPASFKAASGRKTQTA